MSKKNYYWSPKTELLMKNLHAELIINNTNWHKLKNNKSRRAAELLSSALLQILKDGNQSDIEDLIKQSLSWIKGEIKDPGCPSH